MWCVSRWAADWRVHQPRFAALPGGPGTGWDKRDRDSESMSVDPATGAVWVGFESYNQFWRYDADLTRAEAHVAPPAMRRWPENEGPEAMTLLPGGGMATIDETKPWRGQKGRGGIVFQSDPVRHPRRGFRFNYVPPPGYDPSDMTVLPDGRWLILNRAFGWSGFSSVLTVIDPAQVRPGATVRGRDIATLAAPLIHDNFEGVRRHARGARDDRLASLRRQPVLSSAQSAAEIQARPGPAEAGTGENNRYAAACGAETRFLATSRFRRRARSESLSSVVLTSQLSSPPTCSTERSPCADTRSFTLVPSASEISVTFCRLGRNVRLVLLLAWDTLFPTIRPLPVSSQMRAIVNS